MGTHQNCLNESILISTHNIYFILEMKKITPNYHQILLSRALRMLRFFCFHLGSMHMFYEIIFPSSQLYIFYLYFNGYPVFYNTVDRAP